jgi:hypothetical protein
MKKLKLSPSLAAVVYSFAAFCAFIFSLLLCFTNPQHYESVIRTHCGPENGEWLPSLSAVMGDYNPERYIFRIFIVWTFFTKPIIISNSFILFKGCGDCDDLLIMFFFCNYCFFRDLNLILFHRISFASVVVTYRENYYFVLNQIYLVCSILQMFSGSPCKFIFLFSKTFLQLIFFSKWIFLYIFK